MEKTGKRPEHLERLYQGFRDSRAAFGERLTRILGDQIQSSKWEGALVLDLGCGDGLMPPAFTKLGAKVTAVEPDLGRVSLIAKRFADSPGESPFHLIVGDGHKLPLRSGTFDVVILSDVLEHVWRPIIVLQEISRVLRQGGILYLSTTNRFSVVNLLTDPHYNAPGVCLMPRWLAAWYVTKLCRLSKTYNVERYFSKLELVRLFRQVGLSSTEILGLYEEKIRTGDFSKSPGRFWLRALLKSPGPQHLAMRVIRTWFFNQLVQPGWEFLAFKCRRTCKSE